MPPIVSDYLGSIIRTLLAAALAPLVARGLVDEATTAQMVLWLTGVLLVLGWSLVQKFYAKRKQLTAQTMPKGTTESEVKEKIATGVGVPSVMTPATAVPVPGPQ